MKSASPVPSRPTTGSPTPRASSAASPNDSSTAGATYTSERASRSSDLGGVDPSGDPDAVVQVQPAGEPLEPGAQRSVAHDGEADRRAGARS